MSKASEKMIPRSELPHFMVRPCPATTALTQTASRKAAKAIVFAIRRELPLGPTLRSAKSELQTHRRIRRRTFEQPGADPRSREGGRRGKARAPHATPRLAHRA